MDIHADHELNASNSPAGTRPFKRFRTTNCVAKQQNEQKQKQSRRLPLSCGECRRLKLKCDRIFPCQSCVKRGCTAICPDGALTAGAGSRYILANTEQLHDKITIMSERIRNLEEALENLQAKSSPLTHPLLRSDLLLVKNSLELYAPEPAGKKQPGRIQTPNITSDTSELKNAHHEEFEDELPSDIAQLARSFPAPWPTTSRNTMDMLQRIRDLLPSHTEAEYICEQVRQHAQWEYNINPNESFIPKLVHEVYSTLLPNLSARRLALLLMYLAVGCVVDLQRSPDSTDAERFYQLSRASMCESPLMEEVEISTVQTLFMMTWYLAIFRPGKTSAAYSQALMGLNARLAQNIGLHNSSSNWQTVPDKLLERQALYWEMISLDTLLSITLRRLPSIAFQYASCEQPNYKTKTPDIYINIEAHYHEWKHNFVKACWLPILKLSILGDNAEYLDVLKVDSLIRDTYVPHALRRIETTGGSPSSSMRMQQTFVELEREAAILRLHHPFHKHAVNGCDRFSPEHKFSPSVLATYVSSRNIISIVELAYSQDPELCSRFSLFWCGTFAAAITLCLLITKNPACSVAPRSLQELEKFVNVYNIAMPRSSKTTAGNLRVVLDVIRRVQSEYTLWSLGIEQDKHCTTLRDLGIKEPFEGDCTDEFQETPQSLPTPVSTPPSSISSSSNPWDHVHPSLLVELNEALNYAEGFKSTSTAGPISEKQPSLQEFPTQPMDRPSGWLQNTDIEFPHTRMDAEISDGNSLDKMLSGLPMLSNPCADSVRF